MLAHKLLEFEAFTIYIETRMYIDYIYVNLYIYMYI